MLLTNTERAEWPKAAKALYARGANAQGHLLSACVAKAEVPLEQYDRAAAAYRLWLCYDEPTGASPVPKYIHPEACPQCNGTGLRDYSRFVRRAPRPDDLVPCPHCDQTGKRTG